MNYNSLSWKYIGFEPLLFYYACLEGNCLYFFIMCYVHWLWFDQCATSVNENEGYLGASAEMCVDEIVLIPSLIFIMIGRVAHEFAKLVSS
jgi:hypothetical protein